MTRALVGRARRLVREIRNRFTPRRFPALYDVNGVGNGPSIGRALMIYLAKPFLTPPESAWFNGHQNRRHNIIIAHLLGEFGYIVDVVDAADVRRHKFETKRKYDVIVSVRHEADFFGSPSTRGALRIFFATTIDHTVHNRNLRRRHEMLRRRRGSEIWMRRSYSEKMPFVAAADAIIGVGTPAILDTWSATSKAPKYAVNNNYHSGTSFSFEAKDFAAARKNFFFLASGSQVQKGLDLLLEIFPRHPELSLYVCSGFSSEEDFCALYRKELFQTPNIHPIGWIRINSPELCELVEKCACIVYPTCSEGQSGSVVQCMYAGLIPLVTPEAGVDVEGFGITFAEDSLEEIERVILQIASLPETWHRERSRKTHAVAAERHSEAAFVAGWREFFGEVLPRTRTASPEGRRSKVMW